MLTKYLFSVRSLSLLLAMTNSMLGVSLGFFYGAINMKTVIVGICTVFASICQSIMLKCEEVWISESMKYEMAIGDFLG